MESIEKRDDFDQFQPPKAPIKPKGEPGMFRAFFSTMFGKVLFGVSCSILATMIVQSATLVAAIQFTCSVIGLAGDQSVRDKAKRLFDRADETVGKVEAKVESPPAEPKPSFIERKIEQGKAAAGGAVVAKAAEQVEDAKEAVVEKTQEAKQTVVDAKEKVEKKADDVVGALKQKVQERREAEHRPQDPIAIPRQAAPFRGFMPPAAAVKAQCPYCGIPVDLPDSARKPRGCTKCYATYYPADARAAAKRGRRF